MPLLTRLKSVMRSRSRESDMSTTPYAMIDSEETGHYVNSKETTAQLPKGCLDGPLEGSVTTPERKTCRQLLEERRAQRRARWSGFKDRHAERTVRQAAKEECCSKRWSYGPSSTSSSVSTERFSDVEALTRDSMDNDSDDAPDLADNPPTHAEIMEKV